MYQQEPCKAEKDHAIQVFHKLVEARNALRDLSRETNDEIFSAKLHTMFEALCDQQLRYDTMCEQRFNDSMNK